MGIERLGEHWADQRDQRMMARDSSTILIINETARAMERELGFSPLTFAGEPSDVYVDQHGVVYTSRWHRRADIVKTDNQELSLSNLDQEAYRVLGRQQPRPDLLSNLPQESNVSELRYHSLEDGLNGAIRQQLHIMDNRDADQARVVIAHSSRLSTELMLGDLGQERLDELGQETLAILEEAGLTRPTDVDKQQMMEMLVRATWRDSRARINTPAGRFRVRSAFLAARRRLMVSQFVNMKADTNLKALLEERDNTVLAIKSSKSQLDSAYLALSQPDPRPEAVAGLLRLTAYNHLAIVRAEPFIQKSREAALSLVTCRPDKIEINRRIIGAGLADGVMERPSALVLLEQGQLEQAKGQIAYASFLLERVLSEHEAIGTSS